MQSECKENLEDCYASFVLTLPTVQTFCDFWLFPNLKENLKRSHFEDIEKMKRAGTRILDTFILNNFHVPSQSGWSPTIRALESEDPNLKDITVLYFEINKWHSWKTISKLLECTLFLMFGHSDWCARFSRLTSKRFAL